MKTTGSVQNTIMLFKTVSAFEEDQKEQVKNGVRRDIINKSHLQKAINKFYPGGNKTSIRQGFGFGRRLSNGQSLSPTSALTTKDTLNKLCSYIFIDLGLYEWPKTKAVIKEAGEEYAHLLDIGQESIDDRIADFKNKRISEFSSPESKISDSLRRIADEYDQLISERAQYQKIINQSEQAIISMSKEKTAYQDKISELKSIVDRLQKFLLGNPSKEEKDRVEEYLKKVKQKIDL